MSVKTIYVKTTGTCNLDCDHCFTSGKNGDKTQFDPDLTARWVKEYISKYPADQEYHFEFHGGEPFLVPVEKLMQFADQFTHLENVSMCANSNLTFKLKDDVIDFIQDYFYGHVGTSWDPWIRWANEKQSDLWRKNIAHLSSLGCKIHLKVSVSAQMVASSPDWFIDQIEQMGVYDVSLERLTMGGNSVDNPLIFPRNEEQDNWYLALYLRYKERKPNFQLRTMDLLEQKLKMGMVKVDTNCRNCEQHLVTINSNGTLGGCPNMASEHRHATLEDPVDVFLESDGRVNEIVKELNFSETCVRCDVFDLCGGDCHRLPWQEGRCGGLKNTLRYLSGRAQQTNLIIKV